MADKKISELTSLDGTTVAAGDLFPIVDVSGAETKKITLGDVLSISDPAYAVVVQADIGTAPNEVPLNQYLGTMAYQDAANLSGLNSLNGDVFLNASGNVGIGTSSPVSFSNQTSVTINGTSVGRADFQVGGATQGYVAALSGYLNVVAGSGNYLRFDANGAERARITSSGDFLVGTTVVGSGTYADTNALVFYRNDGSLFVEHATGTTSGTRYVDFSYAGARIGSISQNGTTAVAYNTSSDYRLKDNIQDITGSGAFIDALQPRTWNWKADGSVGAGFIAHELQAISPSSVVGEKDAVDADGNPEYQAVEYGSAEVIAMLVAEVKSLRARLTAAGL